MFQYSFWFIIPNKSFIHFASFFRHRYLHTEFGIKLTEYHSFSFDSANEIWLTRFEPFQSIYTEMWLLVFDAITSFRKTEIGRKKILIGVILIDAKRQAGKQANYFPIENKIRDDWLSKRI